MTRRSNEFPIKYIKEVIELILTDLTYKRHDFDRLECFLTNEDSYQITKRSVLKLTFHSKVAVFNGTFTHSFNAARFVILCDFKRQIF